MPEPPLSVQVLEFIDQNESGYEFTKVFFISERMLVPILAPLWSNSGSRIVFQSLTKITYFDDITNWFTERRLFAPHGYRVHKPKWVGTLYSNIQHAQSAHWISKDKRGGVRIMIFHFFLEIVEEYVLLLREDVLLGKTASSSGILLTCCISGFFLNTQSFSSFFFPYWGLQVVSPLSFSAYETDPLFSAVNWRGRCSILPTPFSNHFPFSFCISVSVVYSGPFLGG